VHTVLIADSAYESAITVAEQAFSKFRYHFPPRPSRFGGAMHANFMLLIRDDGFMRITVMGSGLIRPYWGCPPSYFDDPSTATADTMDSAVFIADLPLLTARSNLREQESIPFRVELLRYLRDCLEVDEDI
jgi:hypothetical protein